MKTSSLAAVVAAGGVLAACGGGGASGPGVTVPSPATAAPLATGVISMTLAIPRKPSAAGRSPLFVSPGSSAIAIYDGATLVYVANLSLDSQNPFSTIYAAPGNTTVTPGTCTFGNTVQCRLSITSTIGAHAFDILMYPQNEGTQPSTTPPVFAGVISSEGELSVNLSPGTNPAATLTLLGVADQATYAGSTEAAYNATVTFGYRVQDSTNSQIIQPGNAYDNGPMTIAAGTPGIVTITPSSVATPPASVGDQNFNVQCVNTAGGTVTITLGAQTHPNTTYADALTYTSSNYSNGTLASFSFTCDPATGTIPITVQSKRH